MSSDIDQSHLNRACRRRLASLRREMDVFPTAKEVEAVVGPRPNGSEFWTYALVIKDGCMPYARNFEWRRKIKPEVLRQFDDDLFRKVRTNLSRIDEQRLLEAFRTGDFSKCVRQPSRFKKLECTWFGNAKLLEVNITTGNAYYTKFRCGRCGRIFTKKSRHILNRGYTYCPYCYERRLRNSATSRYYGRLSEHPQLNHACMAVLLQEGVRQFVSAWTWDASKPETIEAMCDIHLGNIPTKE